MSRLLLVAGIFFCTAFRTGKCYTRITLKIGMAFVHNESDLTTDDGCCCTRRLFSFLCAAAKKRNKRKRHFCQSLRAQK